MEKAHTCNGSHSRKHPKKKTVAGSPIQRFNDSGSPKKPLSITKWEWEYAEG